MSWTPELGRREAEGGVPSSRPVPLLGKGRGDREGEARQKRQRNPGAFNQHPLVRPTQHTRNKWTGEGGAGRGVLSGSAVTAAEETGSSSFPCLELEAVSEVAPAIGPQPKAPPL